MRINLAKIFIVVAAIWCFSLTAHARNTSYIATEFEQTVSIDSKVMWLSEQRISEELQKQGFIVVSSLEQANYRFVLKYAAAINMNAQLWHKDSLVIDVYSPVMPVSTTVPITVLNESMWQMVKKEFQQQLEKCEKDGCS